MRRTGNPHEESLGRLLEIERITRREMQNADKRLVALFLVGQKLSLPNRVRSPEGSLIAVNACDRTARRCDILG